MSSLFIQTIFPFTDDGVIEPTDQKSWASTWNVESAIMAPLVPSSEEVLFSRTDLVEVKPCPAQSPNWHAFLSWQVNNNRRKHTHQFGLMLAQQFGCQAFLQEAKQFSTHVVSVSKAWLAAMDDSKSKLASSCDVEKAGVQAITLYTIQ